jgi:L-asparaginase
VTEILVVFTGGTIGSRRSGAVIDVDGGAGYALLERYRAAAGPWAKEIRFAAEQPMTLLSENMTPAHWLALVRCLRGRLEAASAAGPDAGPGAGTGTGPGQPGPGPGRFAGAIVTHGSDTLPYTAAALGYALADARLPIVLTAANRPLDDPRSNGLRNFAAAVDFILDAALPGVYVVFENDRGEMPVMLGTRMTEARPFDDQFAPPYGAPIGHMEGGRFMPCRHAVNPPVAALRAPREPGLPPERIGFATDIVYIRPHPGLDYGLYGFEHWPRRPAAVLHGLYHSATACSEPAGDYESSLPAFAARCAALGIDVWLAPAKADDAARYRSAHEIAEAGGARPLARIAPEAALVKLMAAYGAWPGRDPEMVRAREAFLARNVFFEHHEGGDW